MRGEPPRKQPKQALFAITPPSQAQLPRSLGGHGPLLVSGRGLSHAQIPCLWGIPRTHPNPNSPRQAGTPSASARNQPSWHPAGTPSGHPTADSRSDRHGPLKHPGIETVGTSEDRYDGGRVWAPGGIGFTGGRRCATERDFQQTTNQTTNHIWLQGMIPSQKVRRVGLEPTTR